MPDLQDGESVEVQGSARTPYALKNVRGVYSCACPAWRNLSLPIERRTCKHLYRLRGEQMELARIRHAEKLIGEMTRKGYVVDLQAAERLRCPIDRRSACRSAR